MKGLPRLLLNHPFIRVVAAVTAISLSIAAWNEMSLRRRYWVVSAEPVWDRPIAHPLMAPDGRRLAGCGEDGKLLILTLDSQSKSKKPAALTLPKGAACTPFVWGSDGATILMPYLSDSGEGAAKGFLMIPTQPGRSLDLLLVPGEVDPNVLPAWSKDGKSIAYVAGDRTAEHQGLWRLSLDTGERIRLESGRALSPSFSEDGKRVYYLEDVEVPKDVEYDRVMDDWPHVWALTEIDANGASLKRHARWTQGSVMPTNAQLLTVLGNVVRYLRYYRSLEGSRIEIWDWNGNDDHLRVTHRLEEGHLLRDLRWSLDGSLLAGIDFVTETRPNNPIVAIIESKRVKPLWIAEGIPGTEGAGEKLVGMSWSGAAIDAEGRFMIASVSPVFQEEEEEGADGHEGHDHADDPHLNLVKTMGRTVRLPLR